MSAGQCGALAAEQVVNSESTQLSLISPLAWPLDEYLDIQVVGFLETRTHKLRIPNC